MSYKITMWKNAVISVDSNINTRELHQVSLAHFCSLIMSSMTLPMKIWWHYHTKMCLEMSIQ